MNARMTRPCLRPHPREDRRKVAEARSMFQNSGKKSLNVSRASRPCRWRGSRKINDPAPQSLSQLRAFASWRLCANPSSVLGSGPDRAAIPKRWRIACVRGSFSRIMRAGAIMTLIAEKTYTPTDLLNDPDLAGQELVNGELRERPVSKKSSKVGARIVTLLSNEADKTDTVRFPDVSLLSADRDAEAGVDPGFMPIPPDLAVEVLSPNDRVSDIYQKVTEYLKAGVKLVWLVNPYWRHVHIYRADGSVQLLTEPDEITGESVLPGFGCKVGAFFRERGIS